MNRQSPTQQVGTAAELAVAEDLARRGLKLLAHQFKVPNLGEIDLIMSSPSRLYFIEVKARSDQAAYGGGAAAISPAKQKRLRKTALYYLQKHNLMNNDTRFLAALVTLSKQQPISPIAYVPIE